MLAIIGQYFINFDHISFAEQDSAGLALAIGAKSLHISKDEEEYPALLTALAAYAKGE